MSRFGPKALLSLFILSFILLSADASSILQPYAFSTLTTGITYITTTLVEALTAGAFVTATVLSLLGILLSLTLVAVAYMLDTVFNIQQLKNWYKTELRETIKSIIIFAIIVSVIIILGDIVVSSFATGGATGALSTVISGNNRIVTNTVAMYTTVETQYLGGELGDVNASLIGLFGLYNALGLLKSTIFEIYTPIPILPFPGLYIGTVDFGVSENIYTSSVLLSIADPGNSFTTNMAKIIVLPMLILFQVQADVFPYIVVAGLAVLIPAGIVMRSVPLFRPIGGTLIALGIGTAIVYPALLLFMNMPITSYIAPPVSAATSAPFACPNINTGSVTTTLFCDLLTGVVSQVQTIITPVSLNSPLANNFQYATQGFLAGIGSITSIYPALNFLTSAMYINLLLQFILAILDVVIGFIVTQNIAKILGGNVTLGIGRLKLA